MFFFATGRWKLKLVVLAAALALVLWYTQKPRGATVSAQAIAICETEYARQHFISLAAASEAFRNGGLPCDLYVTPDH